MKQQYTSPLRIGTRNSPLALVQAHLAKSAIMAWCGMTKKDIALLPFTRLSIVKNVSQKQSLSQTKGRFVSHLEEALLHNEIDIAVHSLKDLAAQDSPLLHTSCYLPRVSFHDVLVHCNHDITSLSPGSYVGTSSPRRTAQIKAFRPDLVPVPLEGNVETRLAWCKQDSSRSIILAEAGLQRLKKDDVIRHILPFDPFLPAGGQGIIALQHRRKDRYIAKMLSHIHHYHTSLCATVERRFLHHIGASCQSPVGIIAQIEQSMLLVHCGIWHPDGKSVWRWKEFYRLGNMEDMEDIAENLSHRCFKNAPKELLEDAALMDNPRL